jgi:tetratricopeptide (TPR) repeat protein
MLINQGKRAAMDSALAQEAKRLPNNGFYAYHLVVIPYNDGDYDRAEHVVDSVRVASRAVDTRVFASLYAFEIIATRGRLAEAEQRYREFDVAAAELGASPPKLVDSANVAGLDAWLRGRPQRAVQRLDAALTAHPMASIPEQDRPYALLARLYAVAGRPDRARAMLNQFAQIKDTAFVRSKQPNVHEALGEIALAEKRYADALVEFRRGDVAADGKPATDDPIRVHFNLGRAFDLLNQPDSAIAELEAFTSTRFDGRPDDDWFALAGTHKRLGELYDAKGDRERAVSHLSKFVELWKNADPELQPAVADVKRRLARLQAGSKS